MLLDDCDDLIFENPHAFMKFSRRSICICLTATASESYTGGLESSVLKKMQFKIWKDLIQSDKKESIEPAFSKLGEMSND